MMPRINRDCDARYCLAIDGGVWHSPVCRFGIRNWIVTHLAEHNLSKESKPVSVNTRL